MGSYRVPESRPKGGTALINMFEPALASLCPTLGSCWKSRAYSTAGALVLPPAASLPMPTVSARSLSPRLCKLDSKDNIAQENGLISEEEMVASVEYLVLGHFKREERDEYGVRNMAWLSPADFDSSSTVSKQEVDAKLDEWETLSARVRKEARRLQREGATER